MIPASSPYASIAKMLKANPAISDNPQVRNLIDILESGDNARGEEMANNILKTYGKTKEEALSQAKAAFHIG